MSVAGSLRPNRAMLGAGDRRERAILAALALAVVVLFAGAAVVLGARNASLAAGALSIVFIAAWRPTYGLMIVLALAPLEALGRVDPAITWLTYTRIALLGVLLAIIVSSALRKQLAPPPRAFGLLAVFVVVGTASAVLYRPSAESIVEAIAILLGLVLLWLINATTRSRDDLRLLWWAVVAGSIPVVIVALLDVRAGTSVLGTARFILVGSAELGLWRITSTFHDPNTLGRYLVFAFIITLGVLMMHSSRARWLLLPLMGVQLFCLFNTFSRGATLALAAGVLVLILWPTGTRARLMQAGVLAAGAVAMATYGYRALSATRLVGNENTLFFRVGIWEAAVAAIIDRPLLGFGFGNVETAIGSYFGEVKSSHNIPLEAVLSTGFVGAAALFGYWVYWLVRVVKSKGAPNNTDIATTAALLVAMFVMGMTLHGLRADELWLALAFAPVVVALARPAGQANA